MSLDFKKNYLGTDNPSSDQLAEWPDFTTFYVDIIFRTAAVGTGIGLGIQNLASGLEGNIVNAGISTGGIELGGEVVQITTPRIFLDQVYSGIVENSWAVVANSPRTSSSRFCRARFFSARPYSSSPI